jgi:hypothetical protein
LEQQLKQPAKDVKTIGVEQIKGNHVTPAFLAINKLPSKTMRIFKTDPPSSIKP